MFGLLHEGHKGTWGYLGGVLTAVRPGVLTVVSVQDYNLQRCGLSLFLCISTWRKDQTPYDVDKDCVFTKYTLSHSENQYLT